MDKSIVWFRNVLRLHDNPLLYWASSSEKIESIVPIYIMEEEWFNDDINKIGHNRKKFLYESLLNLNKNFKTKYGTDILMFHGNSSEIIHSILEELDFDLKWLLCDYCPEPSKRTCIDKIKENLVNSDINIKLFPAVNTILDIEKVIASKKYSNPKSSKDIEKIFTENFDNSPHGYLIGDSLSPPDTLNFNQRLMDILINKSPISKYYITEDILKNK